MHIYCEPPSRVLNVPGAHQLGAAMGPRAFAATLADRPPSRPDHSAARTAQLKHAAR
jgi:hypothetical protein